MTTYLQTRAIIAPVKLAHWLPIWNKSCCHMSSFHLFQPSQLSRTFNIQKKEDLSSVFKLFSILVIFSSFFRVIRPVSLKRENPRDQLRFVPARWAWRTWSFTSRKYLRISWSSPSITINHQNVSDSPTQSFEFLFIFLDLNIFSLKPTKRWDCGPTVSCPSLGEEVPSCGAPVNCSGFWDVECSGSQLCAVHAH